MFKGLLVLIFLTISTVNGLNFLRLQQPHQFKQLQQPSISEIENCGSDNDDFQLKSLELTPSDIHRNQNLDIQILGYLKRDINKGSYVNVAVKLGLIRLIDQRLDLCDQLSQVNRKCPVEKGDIDIKETTFIPAEVPPGRYKIEATIFNNDNQRVGCIKANVKIV